MTTVADVRPDALSRRQREVLLWVARGFQNKEIAHALHLSETTVKWHVKATYGLLGADSRVTAVVNAMKRGLISLEDL